MMQPMFAKDQENEAGNKASNIRTPEPNPPGNDSENDSRGQSFTDQARELLTWTLNDVFDWNPNYLKQLRGILNIAEIILSMLALALIGSACQMIPFIESSSLGFYCKSADTFLFVVSCSSFMSSIIHFVCCLLSKKSERRLYGTSFELAYYVVYCSLFFLSGLILVTNVTSRNADRIEKEDKYNSTLAGGVFGIMNCLVYGVSAVWFYLAHKRADMDSA